MTKEFGLADVLTWLNRHKWILLAFTLLSAVTAGLISFIIQPTYESRAILQPVILEDSNQGLGGRGGLSSLAGAMLGGGGGMVDDTTVTLAFMRSNSVIMNFIKDENLLPDLYPDSWDEKAQTWKDSKKPSAELAAKKFARQVTATQDKDGLITVTVKWNSAEKAQTIAQKFVTRINTLRRDQAKIEAERNLEHLYVRLRDERTQELRNSISLMIAKEMRTIMRTESPNDYALKVIDPPLVPEFRASPKRTLLVLIGAVFGFAAGISTIFIRQSLRAAR